MQYRSRHNDDQRRRAADLAPRDRLDACGWFSFPVSCFARSGAHDGAITSSGIRPRQNRDGQAAMAITEHDTHTFDPRFFRRVIGVVIVLWLAVLCLTVKVYFSEKKVGIAELGQFGDTFGLVNALFTGLALVGLVYAASLQQAQARTQSEHLALQREELSRQEFDSNENQRALLRQSREQFLTARLSATVALLQAVETRNKLAGDNWTAYAFEEASRESRKLRQQISILLCESKFGFDEKDWDLDMEKRAIEDHLSLFFREIRYRCLSHGDGVLADFNMNLQNAKLEIGILCDQFRNTQVTTTDLTEQFMKTLSECQSPEELGHHIDNYVTGQAAG